MAKAASNETLRAAFTAHLEETREQARRIERVAGMLGMNPGGKRCKGMAGLIEEGKEIMGEEGEDAVLDAALITAAQKVEHYEISAYGSARTLAERLGHGEASALLQRTLDEEGETDKKLTRIAEANFPIARAAEGGSPRRGRSTGALAGSEPHRAFPARSSSTG